MFPVPISWLDRSTQHRHFGHGVFELVIAGLFCFGFHSLVPYPLYPGVVIECHNYDAFHPCKAFDLSSLGSFLTTKTWWRSRWREGDLAEDRASDDV